MLEVIKSLREFDDLGKFVLFFEPPSLDARIVNQWGIMSIMSGANLSLSEFLKDHESMYYRIIIPKEIKWEIRVNRIKKKETEKNFSPPGWKAPPLEKYYAPGPGQIKKKNFHFPWGFLLKVLKNIFNILKKKKNKKNKNFLKTYIKNFKIINISFIIINLSIYLPAFGGFTSVVSVTNNGTTYPPVSIAVLGKAFFNIAQSFLFTPV